MTYPILPDRILIMKIHISHPDILKRLKRADGHLHKIIQMIEEEKPCLEVAQQFQAVVNALSNAKRVFVQDHIEHCLDEYIPDNSKKTKEKIVEFKELAKYL